MAYYKLFTHVDTPTPLDCNEFLQFVTANLKTFTITDYGIIFNLFRLVIPHVDIRPAVEYIARYLQTISPITACDIAVTLISQEGLNTDIFGDTILKTSFPSSVETILDNLLIKISSYAFKMSSTMSKSKSTTFNSKKHMQKSNSAPQFNPFDPNVDTDIILKTSILIYYLFQAYSNYNICSKSNRITELMAITDVMLKALHSFILSNQADIENDYKLPDRILYEPNPYLARQYVLSHIDVEYDNKRSIASKLLQTYCLLVGVVMKGSTIHPEMNISPYALPITLLPTLYDTFDQLSEDYNCDYMSDYFKQVLDHYLSMDSDASEELTEYISTLVPFDDILFTALLTHITEWDSSDNNCKHM